MVGRPHTILSFLIFTSVAQSEDGLCDLACYGTAPEVWNYELKQTYKYDYSVKTVGEYEDDESSIKDRSTLKATVEITRVEECLFTLQVTDAEVTGDATVDNDLIRDALAAKSTVFEFESGHVGHFCSKEPKETVWVDNIKRGILSSFQNQFPMSLPLERLNVEQSIVGICKYNITDWSEEPEVWLTATEKAPFSWTKSYNCEPPLTGLKAAPLNLDEPAKGLLSLYWSSITRNKATNFIPEIGNCDVTVTAEKHLLRSTCSMEQMFHGGAGITITRRLDFVNKENSQETIIDKAGNGSSLEQDLSQVVEDENATSTLTFDELRAALNDDKDTTTTIIDSLKKLDAVNLLKLENQTNPIGREKFVALLTQLGTEAAITTVFDLRHKRTVFDDKEVHELFRNFIFTTDPTDGMIREAKKFLTLADKDGESVDSTLYFGLSNLINSFCIKNVDCLETGEVMDALELFKTSLTNGNDLSRTIAIMTLENIRLVEKNPPSSARLRSILVDIVTKGDSTLINSKLAALRALEQLPKCTFQDVEIMKQLEEMFVKFENQSVAEMPVPLQIGLFRAIYKCGSSKVDDIIGDHLYKEDVNQVGTYIWDYVDKNPREELQWFRYNEFSKVFKMENLTKRWDQSQWTHSSYNYWTRSGSIFYYETSLTWPNGQKDGLLPQSGYFMLTFNNGEGDVKDILEIGFTQLNLEQGIKNAFFGKSTEGMKISIYIKLFGQNIIVKEMESIREIINFAKTLMKEIKSFDRIWPWDAEMISASIGGMPIKTNVKRLFIKRFQFLLSDKFEVENYSFTDSLDQSKIFLNDKVMMAGFRNEKVEKSQSPSFAVELLNNMTGQGSLKLTPTDEYVMWQLETQYAILQANGEPQSNGTYSTSRTKDVAFYGVNYKIKNEPKDKFLALEFLGEYPYPARVYLETSLTDNKNARMKVVRAPWSLRRQDLMLDWNMTLIQEDEKKTKIEGELHFPQKYKRFFNLPLRDRRFVTEGTVQDLGKEEIFIKSSLTDKETGKEIVNAKYSWKPRMPYLWIELQLTRGNGQRLEFEHVYSRHKSVETHLVELLQNGNSNRGVGFKYKDRNSTTTWDLSLMRGPFNYYRLTGILNKKKDCNNFYAAAGSLMQKNYRLVTEEGFMKDNHSAIVTKEIVFYGKISGTVKDSVDINGYMGPINVTIGKNSNSIQGSLSMGEEILAVNVAENEWNVTGNDFGKSLINLIATKLSKNGINASKVQDLGKIEVNVEKSNLSTKIMIHNEDQTLAIEILGTNMIVSLNENGERNELDLELPSLVDLKWMVSRAILLYSGLYWTLILS